MMGRTMLKVFAGCVALSAVLGLVAIVMTLSGCAQPSAAKEARRTASADVPAAAEASPDRYGEQTRTQPGQGQAGGQSGSAEWLPTFGSAGPSTRPAPAAMPGRDAAKTSARAKSAPGAAQQQAPLNTLVPPQSLPSPDEELWIIQKASNTDLAAAQARAEAAKPNDDPGTGGLVTEDPDSKQTVPVPLKHTDVRAALAGYIATVDVTQQFHNPFSSKIEAVYVFPLPSNAAVNEFVMTIGDRKIRGIIREKEEAKALYAEARQQGHVASLLTQERPNVFTQKVANIEPGKSIDVTIRYFNTLTYADGWYEFAFPMVVGPRFNPPGSTEGIGAVEVGAKGASGQTTEVQYLKPGQRSGHDVSLAVDLGAGVKVEQVESRNHQVRIKRDANEAITRVELDPADSIPNKDFVLRYKVAGDDVKGGLIVGKDAKGNGYFTLMLVPPKDLSDLPRSPVEMFFTLDVSGSMNGKPIEQSKAAMRYAMNNMRPDDTFQVVTFAGSSTSFAPAPQPATKENLRQAMHFVEQAQGSGGTMMLNGIKATLGAPADDSRPRFVAFLTDGYIGNESEILAALHESLGQSRVFSFGVGSSPNRYLLDAMAKMGRGAVAYLGMNDSGEAVMSQYFDRVSHPALTNLQIDWGGLEVKQVFPRELPDLFVGRPVILTGKLTGGADKPTTIKVSGKVGGQTRVIEIPVTVADATEKQNPALPAVWARQMIAELGERSTYDTNFELPQAVKQVALEYGLMSSFTAFVAVDAATKTAGDSGTTVAVPVPVPDGVKYETTVTEGRTNALPGAER